MNQEHSSNKWMKPGVKPGGFSLLEIIMVLLLIGIIGVLTAPILTTVLKGTIMGTAEQQSAEEAYWAAARLTSLIGSAYDVNSSNPQSPEIAVEISGGVTNWHTLAFANNQITYEGNLLWDNINNFTYSFNNNRFHADIQLVDGAHPVIPIDIYVRQHQ